MRVKFEPDIFAVEHRWSVARGGRMDGLIVDAARGNRLAVLLDLELKVLPEILGSDGLFLRARGGRGRAGRGCAADLAVSRRP